MKTLATACKSNASVLEVCMYKRNKLLSLHSVILLCKKVLILRRDENDCSSGYWESEIQVCPTHLAYFCKLNSDSWHQQLFLYL